MVMTKVGLLEDCILLLDALESWTPKSSLDFAAARSKIALLTSSLTCRIEAGINFLTTLFKVKLSHVSKAANFQAIDFLFQTVKFTT